MARIYADNLIIVVGGVLVDPVGVQHAQVATSATNLSLGNGSGRALVLQLENTLVLGLAANNT